MFLDDDDDRLPFAGRFPAALALIPASLACDDDDPGPDDCCEPDGVIVVVVVFFDPERFGTVAEPATRWPVSDPVDDCELSLRGITGRLLDPTTMRLPVLVAALSALTGETKGGGGGGMSVSDRAGSGLGRVGFLDGGGGVSVADEGAAVCLDLAAEGSGGGGISEVVAGLLVGASSPAQMASSYEAGGEANRAVGRGPDVDGPLVFFRIECAGCGASAEGTGSFLLPDGPGPCPESSFRGGVASSVLWLSTSRRREPAASRRVSINMTPKRRETGSPVQASSGQPATAGA